MVSRRFWSTLLLSLGAVFGASPALAGDTSTTTTTSTTAALAASDFTFKLRRLDGDEWVDITTTDQKLFFNQARCQCNEEVKIVITLSSTAITKLGSLNKSGTEARLYVGENCAGITLNAVNCPNGLVAQQNGLSMFTKQGWEVTAKIGDLFKGVAECNDTRSTKLWLWVNSTAGSQPDLTGDSAPYLGISLDGAPPSAPYDIAVESGDEALKVSWADMNADNPDLAGYVVFCMRGEGLQVFNPSPWDDQYSICGKPMGASSGTSSLKSASSSAVEVAPPLRFQELNPEFMCTGRISASDTSTRLRVLQNGISYTVGVAAVDLSGNISPITSAFVQKPIPTVDFYPAYRDADGESKGGYCSLGGWHGRPGSMACLAGAGLLGLFFLRRRRRRRSGGRGLTVLLLLLAAGPAQAQQSPAPSPQTREDLAKTFQEPRSYRTSKNFAFELRFGPYRPDVDSEFADPADHPYKDIYGGKRHLMSQFEFDWQFFQAFGSLSLGGAVGYYSQSAKAFEADPTTGKPKRTDDGSFVRSGDDTSLRLIPTAVLLVYRFDVLALRYGFPLVPYAKLGLNYTFWRITDGNGNVSHYLGGHGSGGTLGWQAAAGISLMLDFIDPMAARGLDLETGVNHTYLFFEWNKVEANGLGQSKKLHVGDSSWVLGLMFEF